MGNAEITITGNLVRDPELRYTPTGIPVCNFTVAVTPREKVSDSEWKDGDPQFWDIVAWRTLAEHVAESLERGDPATVSGRVKFRPYQTRPTDGTAPETKHVHEITADSVSVPLAFHTVTVKRAERKTASNTGEFAIK
jgi:single-strand DNA-binding protein